MSTPIPAAPFDTKDSLFSGYSIVKLTLDAPVTAVTGVASTGVLSKAAHGFRNGQQLVYVSGTGGSGLTAGKSYFVRDAAAGTFKLTETNDDGTLGEDAALGSDLSAAVFQPIIVIEATELSDEPTIETKQLKRPSRAKKGQLFNARTVTTSSSEKQTFKMDDVKRLPEIFAGKLSGRRTGTAQIWQPDVDDATGRCAMVSQEYACTVVRDGKVALSGADFANASISIESNEEDLIGWDRDVDISTL